MLYSSFQASQDLTAPTYGLASALAAGSRLVPRAFQAPWFRHVGALAELAVLDRVRYKHPDWAIDEVEVAGTRVPVREEVVDATPFCSLRRFVKEGVPAGAPVLVVAPLSGHFATLLRKTVATLLEDHDVYVTDWQNSRDVPLADGVFRGDDAIEHVIRFASLLGPVHLLAVCQPCPTALAATALLAQQGSDATPRSLTLMAGPVDCRVNPTRVNELAVTRPFEWFEENVIATVPLRYGGSGRRVYPGFLQLGAFLSMNPYLHVKRHLDAYVDMMWGDGLVAETNKAFYEEYNAVLDLDAAFYLETVGRVFQRFELARGVQEFHGLRIDLGAIRTTRILTVEGERDDICGRGQTSAALDLCTGVPARRKREFVARDVGHYGVFSGRKWHDDTYPVVRDFIAAG